MSTVIKIRRDTLSEWTALDPLIEEGELVVILDANGLGLNVKLGNGVDTFTQLPYFLAPVQTPTFSGTAFGGNAPMVMALADTTNGSFVCKSTGTGDTHLAGISLESDTYKTKFGLRADGTIGIGGASRPAWTWYSDPSGNMFSSGNITAYSDPRLKDNVTNISNPLDIINALNGVRFTWNERSTLVQGKWGKHDIGLMADEVKNVLPEIVTPSIEDEANGEIYDTVDYGKIVAVLVEGMKVQQLQINELINEVNILKGK